MPKYISAKLRSDLHETRSECDNYNRIEGNGDVLVLGVAPEQRWLQKRCAVSWVCSALTGLVSLAATEMTTGRLRHILGLLCSRLDQLGLLGRVLFLSRGITFPDLGYLDNHRWRLGQALARDNLGAKPQYANQLSLVTHTNISSLSDSTSWNLPSRSLVTRLPV